jgi:hypothetical protein
MFVTGWNEWIAMRFDEFNGVRAPVVFVDQFDQEHSRDIEPMKGGHGDDYYYQFVSYVRRYKGVRPAPVAGPTRTMRLEAGFEPWKEVVPEFRDDIGDTAHRDHPGYNKCAQYVEASGRNDFVLLKVAHDDQNVYFYARTREKITPCTDPQWMMLLINADGDAKTGWEGYDFIVNRTVRGPGVGVLEKNAGGWKWEPVAEVRFAVVENELQLAVPRAALGLKTGAQTPRFEFKWADHTPASGEIQDFITQGDVAPNGRFAYRYQPAP